jgi:hypothetical protein
MSFKSRTIVLALLAALGGLPAQAQSSEARDEPAELRAAAEAIDPLAKAAESEAAWEAYLKAQEAAGGTAVEQALALNRMGDSRYY